MNNKLTLRMDDSLIASAKNYASAHGSSVSQMVANYFAALNDTSSTAPTANPAAIPSVRSSPLTRRLTGLLKAQAGQNPVDEGDYRAYLESKHLGPSQETRL